MSLCCREKGLFDAVEAVTLANRKLSEAGSSVRVQLSVAGTFWHTGERAEFDARVSKPDLELELAVAPGATGALERQRAVRYLGFVEGENKRRLLIESDCFCFPTYYPAESFGMVLLEAMAFGLPVIATRWHSIPELLPPGYPGLVQPRNPQELAEALLAQIQVSADLGLRARFLELYTREKFLENFAAALTGLGRH
jgi:glycosyltransferase involved in cell wall biosynthesis